MCSNDFSKIAMHNKKKRPNRQFQLSNATKQKNLCFRLFFFCYPIIVPLQSLILLAFMTILKFIMPFTTNCLGMGRDFK